MQKYIRPVICVTAIETGWSVMEFGTLHNSRGGTQLSKPCNAFVADEYPDEIQREDDISSNCNLGYDWD